MDSAYVIDYAYHFERTWRSIYIEYTYTVCCATFGYARSLPGYSLYDLYDYLYPLLTLVRMYRDVVTCHVIML